MSEIKRIWVVGPHPWDRMYVDDARVLGRVHRTEDVPPKWDWWVCGESGSDDESAVATGSSTDLERAKRCVEAVVDLHPWCGVREDEP